MMRPVDMAEVAARRAQSPDQPLWKPLGEFLDAFYEPGADRGAMLAREPAASIARPEAAYLSAAAEHLSLIYALPTPAWVGHPRYFLDSAFWPEPGGAGLQAICIAESPVSFRRRFIFTEAHPLRRKGGPRSST